MWGELTLMHQTVLVLESGAENAPEKARKTLTILQMSKSQSATVEMLVKAVRGAKTGEKPAVIQGSTALHAIGYLLVELLSICIYKGLVVSKGLLVIYQVELHCRGYANGAAIVQRAAVLLSQVINWSIKGFIAVVLIPSE